MSLIDKEGKINRAMCNYKKDNKPACNYCNPILPCSADAGFCEECLSWLQAPSPSVPVVSM